LVTKNLLAATAISTYKDNAQEVYDAVTTLQENEDGVTQAEMATETSLSATIVNRCCALLVNAGMLFHGASGDYWTRQKVNTLIYNNCVKKRVAAPTIPELFDYLNNNDDETDAQMATGMSVHVDIARLFGVYAFNCGKVERVDDGT
jgi:hypothetical protein